MYDMECKDCYEEVEQHNQYECEYCGELLCESCYYENDDYCKECSDFLRKERSEEEKALWKAFWASKFK